MCGPEVAAQAPERVHAGGRVLCGNSWHRWSTLTRRTDRPRILLYDAYPPVGLTCGRRLPTTPPGLSRAASSPRTTRRPTDIRARSAVSSAQISSRVAAARGTTTASPSSHSAIRAGTESSADGVAQHLRGELGVHGVHVVAQRGPGHRLPAVVARQRQDPADQVGQPEPLAEREVHAGDLDRVERHRGRRSRRCRAACTPGAAPRRGRRGPRARPASTSASRRCS